ncbi:MAG: energy-coupling factor ABC transporter ATP-binding protein [Clostridium sp.]|nr:energy-coupling factor ABC transporter ATP-binding protein [Clostridium sp.]
MISIENVSFGYTENKNMLEHVTLDIPAGECILLCGESGCGKTTVTKLVNGLIPHFTKIDHMEGSVTVADQSVTDLEVYELAKLVGSVFQNPKSQFFHLDTDGELEFGPENQGVAPEEIRRAVERTVTQLGIESLMGRNVFALSGGEKQMLAFASVYAMNPEIYMLDEPTANLDEDAIRKLREQIILLKKQGKTVVIAEHRLFFLADIIDRAVYIRNGEIKQIFSGEEFQALSDKERISMGLRTIHQTELRLKSTGNIESTGSDADFGLCVRALSCGYKKSPAVFENLSFTAYPGEVLGITGHNGVGKSTLIRCLCGLLKEKGGSITLNGRGLKPKQRQKACYLVMQEVNHQLFSDTVFGECEQLGTADPEEIRRVLKHFDLDAYEDVHPMALSGGQKQRLVVATAVLSGREVLIFDEPTSGLDYRHMMEVCRITKQLAKDGRIVLVVSHDKEFMQEACDRLLTLGGGK